MQKYRPWPPLVIAIAASAAACGGARAAGFGASSSVAVLGQSLDFAVQVRLDAGEAFGPDCVSAEVTVGDNRLPAGQVRTTIDTLGPDAVRVRVLTTPVIEEPVVAVQVSAGCGTRLSRRFVVLADPPQFRSAAPEAVFVPAFAAAPPAVVLPQGGGAGDEGAARLDTPMPMPTPLLAAAALAPDRPAARRTPRSPAGPATARTTKATQAERRAASPGSAASRVPVTAEAPSRRARRAAAAPAAAVAAVAVAAAPRLKLEPTESPALAQTAAIEQALDAVAQAASAARASAQAASAASERIAGLERTVEGLRAEAKASRDQAAVLRARLDAAAAGDADRRAGWAGPLLAAVLLLCAVVAWLAWRLRAAQMQRRQDWQAAMLEHAPVPAGSKIGASLATYGSGPAPGFELDTLSPRPPGPPSPSQAPPWPPAVSLGPDTMRMPPPAPPPVAPLITATLDTTDSQFGAESAAQQTLALPQPLADGAAGQRDVSIEELIDLEQQAEFFLVLGQDDAAIELLAEHLRQTGGSSPLPYLKLLEIYRRNGDQEGYERTRTRFNQRFNAYAPAWEIDMLAGRTLDAYPAVLPRLQNVWARPLDAMAELEALLFRKTRGDLFDLPAYREVLFLYSLARDLLDHEAADTGHVDLLLPLSDGGEFGSTSPAPFLGLQRQGTAERADVEERTTSPVDLDLSSDSDERPTSIFGTLAELDERPRRR